MADLSVLRDDVGVFASEIGFGLEDWQAAALRLERRTTCVVAGRQSGKSRSAAVVGLHRAYRKPKQFVLIVSAGEEASRRVLREVRDIATSSPLLKVSVADESASLIVLSNGSRIKSVPASERAIRGERAHLLIADEAALISDEVLEAAEPTTAAQPGARILYLSTATTTSGRYYDVCMLGDAGSEYVETFRWQSTLAGGDVFMPWLNPSAVAAWRESMSAARFSAEFECDFASGSDALITRAALDEVTADYAQVPLAGPWGSASFVAGVDWASGQGRDSSSIVMVGRPLIERDEAVFAVALSHAWRAEIQPHVAVGEIAAAPAVWARLYPEANGLGWPLSQMLVRAMVDRPRELGGGRRPHGVVLINDFSAVPRTNGRTAPWWDEHHARAAAATGILPVHVNAELKSSAYGSLRLMINRGQLLVPESAVELRRELLLLRVELTEAGIERIETGGKDLASALMLSLGPFKSRLGRWETMLAKLAEQPLDTPEIPAALTRQPSVSTPGGLTLPRAVAWQSINSQDVTLPDGVGPPDPDAEAHEQREQEMEAVRERVRAAMATNGGAE